MSSQPVPTPLPMSAAQPAPAPTPSERDATRSATRSREAIAEHKVILFMKGTPEAPACGFSARTVAVLQALDVPFAAVDILPDPRIRQELLGALELAHDPAAVRRRRAASAAATSSPRCTSPGELAAQACACSVPRRMAPVAVATDSTHYLPARARRRARASTRSACTSAGKDEPERELEMDGFDAFYERLRNDPELPTTSQPSIGDFLAVWEPLLDAGQRRRLDPPRRRHLRHLSRRRARRTGCCAERGLGERVEVIDGETACGGTGLLVLAAAAAARDGADHDAVTARVREARAALRIWFCLDTLEYLGAAGASARRRRGSAAR